MKDDFVIRCYNLEDSYGFQVMMDILMEKGLAFKEAWKVASIYYCKPKVDQGVHLTPTT